MAGIILLPSTLNLAFKLPSAASNPACTMPLLALLCPIHTSSSFSSITAFTLYRMRFLKTKAPTTPPPITATSDIPIFNSFYYNVIFEISSNLFKINSGFLSFNFAACSAVDSPLKTSAV